MSCILALDQGTTSSRSLLINAKGEITAMSQKPFHQSFPKPGWIEHNPEEIWQTQYQTAKEVIERAKCDVAAIGITNQRETTVVWDKETGKSVSPAIVWQDRRTAHYCSLLRSDGLEELFQKKTGLLLDPYFSATKLIWILENVPGVKDRASKGKIAFGTIDSWLVWNLTKGKLHITDITNASRTLLFNIHECKWDEELMELLDIPSSVLPEVRSNSEIYGETDPSVFPKPIPIGSMVGDQQAALFGQACFTKGDTKCTLGTGSFILMHTGNKPAVSKHHLLSTIACQIQKEVTYALEGSVFICGAAVNWLRDNLGMIQTPAEIETLAKQVSSTEGVYFVPAFTGLGAPHWNPYARGLIIGLTRGTTKSHIARGVLEGIAHQVRDVVESMQNDSGIEMKKMKVDGGVSANDLLMQIQSDFLQMQLERPIWKELTALGAGFLAGLACGVWKNKQEIAALWKQETEFSPQKTRREVEEEKVRWSKAVRLAKEWPSK